MSSWNLKKRIASGETVVGSWLMTPSHTYLELASAQAVDFVVIDLEHGDLSLEDVSGLMRTLAAGPTAALVRVPSHDATLISRLLDRGAHGIIVPRVDDVATATAMAAAAQFPPIGRRGLALGAARGATYGLDAGYRTTRAKEALMIVQIESRAAMDAAVEIATAPGVDMAFIGPGDLSADLGLERPEDQAALIAAVDSIRDRVRAVDVPLGTIPHAGRTWQTLAKSGFRMLVVNSDIAILKQGVADLALAARNFRTSA